MCGSIYSKHTPTRVEEEFSGLAFFNYADSAEGRNRRKLNNLFRDSTPKSQKLAAKIVHFGMYFCLAAIPLTGLLIGYLFSLGFKDGFLINLITGAHEFSVAIIYWLIGIHVLAATYHRLKRDGVWSSMVPFFKEKN